MSRHVACWFALASLMWAQAARADSAPLPTTERQSLASARAAANKGDCASAVPLFEHAYELGPNPRTLWELAQCHRKLKHNGKATRIFERFLDESEGKGLALERAEAQKSIGAMASSISAVRVAANQVGVAISVDGEAAGVTPLPAALLLDLGAHKIQATKDGYNEESREITLAEAIAETSTRAPLVQFTMQPVKKEEVKVLVPEPAPVEPPKKEGSKVPTWAWIAGGAGVAVLLGVGAAVLLTSSGDPAAPPGQYTFGVVELP